MPKVLIVTGDAAEDLEVFYPYQRLLEEGYDVHIAAPSRKKLQFVVHDGADGFDTFTEKPGHTWPSDISFAEVDPDDYVALVVPGGRAPEYLRLDADFRRIVEHFFTENKPVAHICHGAIALVPLGVLAGRHTAAWPHCAPDVEAHGATFVNSGAVVDGNMVSARAWSDHPEWMRAFLRLLRTHAPI